MPAAYVNANEHGDDAQVFLDVPSTNISMFDTPDESEAVAVTVTAVDCVMPVAGECEAETVGGVVSVGRVTLP